MNGDAGVTSNQQFPLYSQTDAENLGSDEHMAQFKGRDWILSQKSPGMELDLPSHRMKIMLFRGTGEFVTQRERRGKKEFLAKQKQPNTTN